MHFICYTSRATLRRCQKPIQEKNQAALDEFILPLEGAEFDERAAMFYGALCATLEKQGALIRALDMMIGAHALSLNVSLVTNNTKEFNRVLGLTGFFIS